VFPVTFDLTLFVVAVVAAMLLVGVALSRQVMLLTGRTRLAALEHRNQQLRRRHQALATERERHRERLVALEAEERSLHGQLAELERRVKAAQAENFVLVHEIGEPGGRRRLFSGVVGLQSIISVNNIISRNSKLRGVRHLLEVWTDDPKEATRMARQAFPEEHGFTVPVLAGQDARPSASASAG